MFTPYTTFITTTTKCSKIQGFFITFFFEKIDFFGAYKTPDKFPQFTYINNGLSLFQRLFDFTNDSPKRVKSPKYNQLEKKD